MAPVSRIVGVAAKRSPRGEKWRCAEKSVGWQNARNRSPRIALPPRKQKDPPRLTTKGEREAGQRQFADGRRPWASVRTCQDPYRSQEGREWRIARSMALP